MRSTIPQVTEGRLYRSEAENDPIVLGTPEWYDWLEQHDAFTFVDSVGTFTARKSMLRTGGSYWKAYRTRQGKLYLIHLGYSRTLTLEKLNATAGTFASEHVSGERADASSVQSSTSKPSMHISPRKALTVDHSMALIQTKLCGPRKRSDLIIRDRLLERLNAGLSGKVTLLSAPAGFGKTTLIAQWIQSINRHTAWLSLDEHDNDLRVFVRSLSAALQSTLPDMFQGIASLYETPRFPSVEHVVSLLINDLADISDDLILVLDDYHLIRTRDIHTLLDLLIEHLPPQLHLVLATRSDPSIPVHRWRALGYLNDLRPADLRFTLEETEAFLHHELGKGVAHETTVSLEEQTGGWIAILRLAALSLRNTPDIAAFLEQLHRYTEHSIQSYLVEEVLAQLEPAVQDMLVKTSILEQFCAELCMAILGNDTSLEQVQTTLNWLERSNVFVIRLDERQGWYRFHHLFGQLLKQRLQMLHSQEELALLHRRASEWYAEQGLIEQAIEHVLEAGDVSGATRLVEAQFLPAFEQEQLVQMDYWLGLLSEEQIQGSPLLLVARAWLLQARGQLKGIPPLLTAAEKLLAMSDRRVSDLVDSQRRLLQALIAIHWSHFQYFTGQVQASLESTRSARELLTPSDEYIASIALVFQSWSLQAIGQEEAALLELNNALKERSMHLNSTARLLFAQAWVYLAAGKLHQVEQTARHLLQVAQEANVPFSQNFAHWFLGVVYYEWNNLDAAIYHFSAVIANRHQAHLWVVRDALCGLALTYQAQGLDTRAQETAHTLIELVQEQHNMGELLTAYAFCGRLALLQDDEEQAAHWLELAGEQEIRGPMLFLEDPPVTRAWMFLAQGDEVSVTHGQALLDKLLQHVESIHSTRKTIQVLALQAWAYDQQGRAREALDVLEYALTLARPNGFIRTFADLQPLAKVLHELRKRRKSRQKVDRKVDTYLQSILAAMNSRDVSQVSTEALLRQEGLEPLTDRELRILRLLDKDFTNKEIARQLVITTGTVKVHISNVYRKLSVNNRRAAVSLARALGFLPADQAFRPQFQ
jgi:LuxR family transcriptional regulator, maltose regulon positive regulatory protein